MLDSAAAAVMPTAGVQQESTVLVCRVTLRAQTVALNRPSRHE
jgi:hypothetical protein